jgi:MAternally-affected-uncoordination protein
MQIDLYGVFGEHARQQEAIQMHHSFSQMLLNDHYTASQSPEHNYIHVGFNYCYLFRLI